MHCVVYFKNSVPAMVLPTEFRTIGLQRAIHPYEEPHYDDCTHYGSHSAMQDLYKAFKERMDVLEIKRASTWVESRERLIDVILLLVRASVPLFAHAGAWRLNEI